MARPYISPSRMGMARHLIHRPGNGCSLSAPGLKSALPHLTAVGLLILRVLVQGTPLVSTRLRGGRCIEHAFDDDRQPCGIRHWPRRDSVFHQAVVWD